METASGVDEEPGEPDPDSVRQVIRDLLDLWPGTTRRISGWRPEIRNVTVITAHGLVAHCHRLAEAVMRLDGEGYRLEVYPLARAAFEAALTAAWLAHVPDAPEAFVNAEWRSRRLLLDDVGSAWGEEIPRDEIEAAAARQPDKPYETASQESARFVRQLCDDLEPAGKKAYVIYRMLSSYAHPSGSVADLYLQPGKDHELPVLLNFPGRFDGADNLALKMTGASLVWGERAMLSLAAEPPAGVIVRLEAASRTLGVAAQLTASTAAQNRSKS